MSDDDIIMRGGTQDDIDSYAEFHGGMTTPQEPTEHQYSTAGSWTDSTCERCKAGIEDWSTPCISPQEPTAQEELRKKIMTIVQDTAVGHVLRSTMRLEELIEAEATRRARQAVKAALEELNQKLFFSTTQPDGQFIKDTINAKLKEIEEKRLSELKAGEQE